MSFQFTSQIIPIAAAAAILVGLFYVAWNNRKDPVGPWFAATIAALFIWCVGYVLEILAQGLQAKTLFANTQFIGAATSSVCWWYLTRRYLGSLKTSRFLSIGLWLIPAATIALAFTNPARLFRVNPIIEFTAAPFPVLHADYGPWILWVFLPFLTLVNVSALFLLIRSIIRNPGRRRHTLVLLVSLLMPLSTTIVYVLDVLPWKDYNPTPIMFGVSGLLLTLGLFRWRLFDIVPLARDLVVENLADGVIVTDRSGQIVDMNLAAERITGVTRRDAVGGRAGSLFAGFTVLAQLLEEAGPELTLPTNRTEMMVKTGPANRFYSLTSSPVSKRGGRFLGRAVVLHDITERVSLFEQARELASKDDLTGLFNRRHFFELTAKELERSRRYHTPAAMVFMDVDHFKIVNDTYGHRMGDAVLRGVADACKLTLRDNDLMGRFGGEEFAVLLPHTPLPEAMAVAERLRVAVESLAVRIDPGDKTVGVTVSVGVAEFGEAGGAADTLDAVLERADQALYAAKEAGRNRVVASPIKKILKAVG